MSKPKSSYKPNFTKHALECFACSEEIRWSPNLHGWAELECKKCGCLYFDWLSWELRPVSVYLNCEVKYRFFSGRIRVREIQRRAKDSKE